VMLIPICILGILQVYLDLIRHFRIDVFTTQRSYNPNDAKCHRRIGNSLDTYLIGLLYCFANCRNDSCVVLDGELRCTD